ncbi:MAG: 50S ribosomal protein L22 [Clostridia bacterium]|nr:50S ribosomal protein L22 [Clostridia bacterium]
MATRSREKAIQHEQARDKRPHAIAKYIRMSPSKVNAVLDLIRGKDYFVAVATLKGSPRIASEPVLKVLNSAAANAEVNQGLSKDTLYVAECYTGQGPTLKRFQPVSKGRAHSILKRTSHITVVLDQRV